MGFKMGCNRCLPDTIDHRRLITTETLRTGSPVIDSLLEYKDVHLLYKIALDKTDVTGPHPASLRNGTLEFPKESR